MEISVARYHASLASDWATILSESKNGLFLFDRKFIEYHGERFTDLSVIAYVDGRPVAFLPAAMAANSDKAVSHPGLTFGGAVLRRDLRGGSSIAVINSMLDGMRDHGARSLMVKLLPQMFANYPAGELEYVLWRRGFKLVRRDLSSVLPLTNPLPFNTSKKQSVRKAKAALLSVEGSSTQVFHSLLENVLRLQHNISPIHTQSELETLISRFPHNIFIRAAYKDGEILAGTMIFRYGYIWHTQYLASSSLGRKLGALDLVISTVKDEATAANAHYLSFGSSTEDGGAVVNEGLLWQKESYGARTITHDFMEGVL